VLLDVGCVFDPRSGDRDLQLVGADLGPAKRDERQVGADEAFLNGGELRLIGLDVDVDVLELAVQCLAA